MDLDMATSSAGKGKILSVDCSSELPAYALDVKPSWCASAQDAIRNLRLRFTSCVRNKLCMENELVSPVSLKICTENYAHLLINCFWQQQSGSLMRLIRWND